MTDRRRVALGHPPAADALVGFPAWHVHAGTTMYRVSRDGRNPWWFSSDASGRFDLRPPRGTCYLADEPIVALLEALGAGTADIWSSKLLERLNVWMVPLPAQCTAADATHRRGRGSGVTAELSTVTDYELPQAWAEAWRAAGFGGVRYRARHDPAGGRCLALFGRAGERRSWAKGTSTPAIAFVVELLEAGVVVPRVPNADELSEVRDRPPD